MDSSVVMDIAVESLVVTTKIAMPILGAALLAGILVGVLQAATSIQEMTLSFVPKIVLVILAMGMMANFFLVSLTDYFQFIFETISGIK